MPHALSTTTPVTVAGGGSWGTALAHLLAALSAGFHTGRAPHGQYGSGRS